MKKRMKSILLVFFVIFFSMTTFTGCNRTKEENGQLTFAYLASFLSHEFYQRAISGMETEAKSHNVKLLIADSNNDVSTQVGHMETYIAQKPNAIILSAVDPNSLISLVQKAKAAGIVVVSDGQPIGGGEDTIVGNDWYDNGRMLGEWLVEEVRRRGIEPNILVVGLPTLPIIVDLEKGFTDSFQKSGIVHRLTSVDGQGMKEDSLVKATDALTANPDINIIFGINDDSILGAIQAAKALGLDPTKMITMTNGLEGNAGCIAMAEEGTLTVACALFPEIYGAYMVKASIEAVDRKLPELYMSPVTIVTKENMSKFYVKQGEDYVLNYENALSLLK